MPKDEQNTPVPAQDAQTIDAYIALQPEQVQERLQQVRETLRAVLPDAKERISWRMPTFWQGQNLIHFAAFKNHIGIFPGAEAMEYFTPKLTDYHTSKGGFHMPHSQPLPLDLLTEIALWRLQMVQK